MVLNSYRDRIDSFLLPFAKAFSRISPNALSAISLVCAFLAMIVLVFIDETISVLIAMVFVILNGFFDAIDGKVAKLSGKANPRGDLVDHVIDRFADFFILVGISLSSYADVRIGLIALGCVLIASYMGTQSQALGVQRDYGGVLGRAERVLLTIVFLLVSYIILEISPSSFEWALIGSFSVSILDIMMLLFIVLAIVTTLQRFVRIWRRLGPS